MANNTNVTSMSEYIYNEWNGKGPVPALWLPPLFLCLIAVYGYIGNGLVVVATIKNKNLHGSCNIFLSISSLSDIVHMSAHWIYFVHTVMGNNFIPYVWCFWFNSPPQFFLTISITMTLFVGLDRLFSVALPTMYRATDKRVYIACCICVSCFCSTYFYVISIMNLIETGGTNRVLCVIINSFGGRAFTDWFYFCVCINIADLLVYSCVWVFLKAKTGGSEETRKVFRSLFVIMLTVALGWLANAFAQAVIMPLWIPIDQQYAWLIAFGYPVNIASSSNFITLYIFRQIILTCLYDIFFSQEYRNTFVQLIPILARGKRQGSRSVVSVSNTPSKIVVSEVKKPI